MNKNMTSQIIDIIIFGATGYTGQCVVEQCARINNFSWAIAGRNVNKLREVLTNIYTKTGKDVTQVEIIVADVDDQKSINAMTKKGKVIINCTGPYRFYGESVVKACIEEGIHYVDVTGEPEFMEKMQLKYHDLAKTSGSYVVSACGMDSVPADIGVIHFMKNFNGQVNYVEAYMALTVNTNKIVEPFLNYTTWESAVHALANMNSLRSIRKQLFSKYDIVKLLPSIPRRSVIHRSELCENKYCLPFQGSDRSVVLRTQMFLTKEWNLRPIQCNVYLVCRSAFTLCALLIIGFFLQVLSKFEFGRKLLLKYSHIFSLGVVSRNGPTAESRQNSLFTMKFYGEGWSKDMLKEKDDLKTISEPTDSYMVTAVEIPDAGYGFTSICAVQCALIILNEFDKLPPGGGVYTPGAAFYRTSLIETLAENGFQYKILHTGHK